MIEKTMVEILKGIDPQNYDQTMGQLLAAFCCKFDFVVNSLKHLNSDPKGTCFDGRKTGIDYKSIVSNLRMYLKSEISRRSNSRDQYDFDHGHREAFENILDELNAQLNTKDEGDSD